MNACQNRKKNSHCRRGSSAAGTAAGSMAGTMTGAAAETEAEKSEPMVPAIDIIEQKNEFVILADMPGADEESIDINFNAGELPLSAAVETPEGEEEVVCCCEPFSSGGYFRAFRIGESINADDITADYQNGVLTIHLPKKAELAPRKITVGKN